MGEAAAAAEVFKAEAEAESKPEFHTNTIRYFFVLLIIGCCFFSGMKKKTNFKQPIYVNIEPQPFQSNNSRELLLESFTFIPAVHNYHLLISIRLFHVKLYSVCVYFMYINTCKVDKVKIVYTANKLQYSITFIFILWYL